MGTPASPASSWGGDLSTWAPRKLIHEYLLLPVIVEALTAVSSVLIYPDDNEPMMPLHGLAKSSDH